MPNNPESKDPINKSEEKENENDIETEAIKSPEQQSILKPEESPEDVKIDIDAAKKYLEEAYGPEKSSIIVDQSIPILEKQEKESKKKPEAEELKPSLEKEVSKEAEKKESTAEKEKIKAAKNGLINLAESINEARENKEREAEIHFYEEAKKVFEIATGESLEKTAKEKAKIEAESEGLKVITPEEYRKEKTLSTQERIRQKERSAVIRERWDMMTDKEKEKYFNGTKDKNDPVTIDSARIKFATELKGKIDAKKQELSKGKDGISISEDVFYELMKKGLKSENIKKRGFFGRIFFGGEIIIPSLNKTDGRESLIGNKKYLTEEVEIRVKKNIEDAAREEIERKIIEGQRIWRGRKQRHTREIIQETAVGFKAEKKLGVKPEPEEKRASKITEVLKPFGKIGDIERLINKVNSDIDAKKEQQKKMQELKRKIKRGEILTLREKSFLNKIDSSY